MSFEILLGRYVTQGKYTGPDDALNRYIPMDAQGEVVVAAHKKGRIYTDGLCGCTAVAMATVYEGGLRLGYLQHYSPSARDTGLRKFANYVNRLQQTSGIASAAVTLMTPGIAMAEDLTIQDEITTTAQQLGSAAVMSIHLYNKRVDFNTYPDGHSLTINLTESGETQIVTA